jgi:hypothetical protein
MALAEPILNPSGDSTLPCCAGREQQNDRGREQDNQNDHGATNRNRHFDLMLETGA